MYIARVVKLVSFKKQRTQLVVTIGRASKLVHLLKKALVMQSKESSILFSIQASLVVIALPKTPHIQLGLETSSYHYLEQKLYSYHELECEGLLEQFEESQSSLHLHE